MTDDTVLVRIEEAVAEIETENFQHARRLLKEAISELDTLIAEGTDDPDLVE